MVELNKEQYLKLRVLLEPFIHQLVLPAILLGRAPGKRWSDDPESPSLAVVWDMVNTFVFCAADASSPSTVERVGSLLTAGSLPGGRGGNLPVSRAASGRLESGAPDRRCPVVRPEEHGRGSLLRRRLLARV